MKRRTVGEKRRPKGTHWLYPKCVEWLEKHPVVDAADILYLRHVTDSMRNTFNDVFAPPTATGPTSPWRGLVPYLRLILCLVEHDDIKAAWIRRNDPLSLVERGTQRSQF
jgi:hypothetical protein